MVWYCVYFCSKSVFCGEKFLFVKPVPCFCDLSYSVLLLFFGSVAD